MDQRSPWLVVVASSLLLAIALWAMRASLGPVAATGGLVFLLWPYRRHAPARRVLYAALLLFGVWILAQARTIVYPALAALALAFLLDPAVDRLQRHGLPRSIAALAVMLPILALVVAAGMMLAPVLIEQGRALLGGVPELYTRFVAWIGPLIGQQPQVEGAPAGPLAGALPASLPDLLPYAQTLLRGVFSGVAQVGRGIRLMLQLLSFALLTPILTYYILVDFSRLRETLRPHVPPAWLPNLAILGERLQMTVGAWLKGQLIVAAAVAILITTGFFIIGLPYALLLGFMGGILNLVPMLGFWITGVLALFAALLTPAPLSMLLKVAIVLFAAQLLEQQVLSPRIVGRQLGVKPVVLLLVMLTLATVLGMIGLLLAAPVLGIARGVWEIWGPKPKEPSQTAAPPLA